MEKKGLTALSNCIPHKPLSILIVSCKLLRLLELQGALVSIDALGCQKDIAQAVRDTGADYLLQVKGKVRPTAVYESLGHHTPESFPKLSAVVAAYEAGFDAYQQRDWTGALGRFGDALELAPNDRPSRIFIDRCRYYRENPPPQEWNGVWIMEEK